MRFPDTIFFFILITLPSLVWPGEFFDYVELDLGGHAPQHGYSRYADPGLSGRLVWSRQEPLIPILRYDLELQLLLFRWDSWNEPMIYVNGHHGPWVDVTNSEQSLSLSVGPRLTLPSYWSPVCPYVSLKGGLFFFYERTTWEWGECYGFWDWVFGNECEDDCEGDKHTEILDSEFHPGWMLEIGGNFFSSGDVGIDIGIQYTDVHGLKRPYTTFDEDQLVLDYETRRIQADFISIYFGVTFR